MWFHKRYDFFGLLLEQARVTEEGLKLLVEFVEKPGEEMGCRVEQAEKAADEVRRRLIDALNRTFVTPLDREDIFSLSRAVDDMVDYAKSTVEEMVLFQVQPNRHLRDMAMLLYEGAQHITRAIASLGHMPGDIQAHIILAKKSENKMEHLYREALAELFTTPDVVTIIKMREIYRHLSNAADRGDEAADILSDILVKNT
jgi:predicted phosphate transport protein (TIGR00153 family)